MSPLTESKVMKALIQLILIVAVFFGAQFVRQCQIDHAPKVQAKVVSAHIPMVEVVRAKSAEHKLAVMGEGIIAAPTRLSLAPEIAGRVLKVGPGFEEGARLSAGATLIEIDPADYELSKAAAAATIQAAKAALDLERSLAAAAVADWQVMNTGDAPALVARTPQIAAAQAKLAVAEVALAQAELQLARTQITMPFAGRIVSKHVDLGQRVDPAMPITIIERAGDLEVRLSLELADLGLLGLDANGAGAAGIPIALEASIGGLPMRWNATGARTAADLSPTNPVVTLIGVLDPSQSAPPPGLFVRAKIDGNNATGFMLPRRVLRVDGSVLVVDEQNHLTSRQIEVLQTTRDTVLITGGLSEGDMVVITPPPVVVENMRVRLAEDKQPGA